MYYTVPYKMADRNDKSKPWYLRDVCGIEIGPTGAAFASKDYASKMSGKDWVEKSVVAGADYLVVFCKDEFFAYYDSKIRPRPDSFARRDILQECIDAAKDYELDIIAYCEIQYDFYMWDKYNDVRMVSHEGNELQKRICFNSDRYYDYIISITNELLKYDIKGFHFDMLDMGFDEPWGCWCENCREKFKQKYKIEYSKINWSDDNWKRSSEFRYNSNYNFAKNLEQYIKKIRPELTVDFNYHGAPPFSFEVGEKPVLHAKNGDFVTAETLPWTFGYYNITLMCNYAQSARKNTLFQAVGSRSVYQYHDYTIRPIADIAYEALGALACGSIYTMVDKAGYDGYLDMQLYKRLRIVFDEMKRKAPYCLGYEKQIDCGIYFSVKTRDFIYNANPQKYLGAIGGIHKALSQLHYTYRFIFDEEFTLDDLKNIPVLILPNTALISENEARIFREYVKNGGKIFATGACGIYDEYANEQKESIVADIFGVSYKGIANSQNDTYIRFLDDNNPLGNSIEIQSEIFVRGEMYNFSALTADSYAELCTGFKKDKPQSDEKNDTAALAVWGQIMSAGTGIAKAFYVNRYGTGECIYIPCHIDRAFCGRHRVSEHRNIIGNAINYLYSKKPVKVKASLNTEIIIYNTDSGYIVNLLTFNGTIPHTNYDHLGTGRKVYPPIMEEPMLYECELELNTKVLKANSVDRTELKVNDNKIKFVSNQILETIEIIVR